jgi:N-methylhydantoinase A
MGGILVSFLEKSNDLQAMPTHTDGAFVGVDIGGTFTDLVLRKADGTMVIRKVSSTPDDPGQAILTGLHELCESEGVDPASIVELIHGTTVATNAILEQKGARTGLLTTKGFRDVLEIARIRMPSLFDLTWDKPQPLVERRYRLEIDERIDGGGQVIKDVVPGSVLAAVDRLVVEGVESVAICLLNSYRNSAHEQAVERLVRERHPDLFVTCSYQVLPEIKEYERTSTTVVNAYILPKVKKYLKNLEEGLQKQSVSAPILIVASNGGVMSLDAAANRPVNMVASGPAAGVSGAAKLLKSMGLSDAITFDMGGTTAKAALIEGGEPFLTTEYEVRAGISTSSRFIKAGGYLLQVPAIDIGEVGSGGGSIAWVDNGGALQVGPKSAGAVPGPVCYGLGGTEPTVTDANVVLGYIHPDYLAGGSLRIDRQKSIDAIRERIAEPLGLTIEDAAYGIRQVANANMIRAVRSVTIERGRDPRDFAIVAFGGNGPVHGADIAGALDIGKVIIPKLPGVFSAVGMLTCDVQHQFVASLVGMLRDLLPDMNEGLAKLAAEGTEMLRQEGYTGGNADLRFSVDLRYHGQSSELMIPIPLGHPVWPEHLEALEQSFLAEYKHTYGYETNDPIELVNLRLSARGIRTNAPDLANFTVIQPSVVERPTVRQAFFGRLAGYVETTVIDRNHLTSEPVAGPVIIESYDSTIVVPPGASASLDQWGNVEIHTASIAALSLDNDNQALSQEVI